MKLDIQYNISTQLLHLLTIASGKSKQEVCSELKDLAHTCLVKLDVEDKMHTNIKAAYPKLNVYLNINATREGSLTYPPPPIYKGIVKGNVRIQLAETSTSFSSKQVDQFIVNKLILGAK